MGRNFRLTPDGWKSLSRADRAYAESKYTSSVDVMFKACDMSNLSENIIFSVEKACGKFFEKVAANARANLSAQNTIRTGLLQKAVGYKSKAYIVRKKTRGKATGYQLFAGVGINREIVGIDENGKKINPVKYAHLVEFGHSGSADVPAKPFMRTALASAGGAEAINKLMQEAAKNGAFGV